MIQIDPLTLAVPFLAKGAEAFSKSAGEKLVGKAGELFQAVIEFLRGAGCGAEKGIGLINGLKNDIVEKP